MNPEALARLRAWEFDGQDADDFRALLDAYDTARAQVEAARAFIEDDTCRHDDEKRAVLRAMDEAAKR